MAYPVAVSPAGGQRTWTVLSEDYATVGPVEAWIEAHRHLWSPNTVRGYAKSKSPVRLFYFKACAKIAEGPGDDGWHLPRDSGRLAQLLTGGPIRRQTASASTHT